MHGSPVAAAAVAISVHGDVIVDDCEYVLVCAYAKCAVSICTSLCLLTYLGLAGPIDMVWPVYDGLGMKIHFSMCLVLGLILMQ